MAAMGAQALPLSAARASGAIGMEQFDEPGVAGVLVQIRSSNEKSMVRTSVPQAGSSLSTPPLGVIVSGGAPVFPHKPRSFIQISEA